MMPANPNQWQATLDRIRSGQRPQWQMSPRIQELMSRYRQPVSAPAPIPVPNNLGPMPNAEYTGGFMPQPKPGGFMPKPVPGMFNTRNPNFDKYGYPALKPPIAPGMDGVTPIASPGPLINDLGGMMGGAPEAVATTGNSTLFSNGVVQPTPLMSGGFGGMMGGSMPPAPLVFPQQPNPMMGGIGGLPSGFGGMGGSYPQNQQQFLNQMKPDSTMSVGYQKPMQPQDSAFTENTHSYGPNVPFGY